MNVASHFVGFSGGLLMSVIAFSIVFLVCVGLMIMMMVLKMVAGGKPKPAAKPAPAPVKAAPAAPAAPAPAAAASADEELVAVITAAIMAMGGTVGRIMSITPAEAPAAGRITSWRMDGILNNMEGLG